MGKPIISSDDVLAYYRRQSRFTDPGEYASLYDGLPEGISDLCTVLQGAILHMFWIGEKTYGVTTEELKAAGREICVEFAYETAEERLRNIVSLDERPLAELRPADVRSVGCCRDLAMMLVSILRHRGIPARVRTGVARYFFTDGKLEDHYLCESWNAEERRWQLTDPQIDAVQRAAIGLTMDTIDVPREQFLSGWAAFEEVRSGRVGREKIGFPPGFCGREYTVNKLFGDLMSLTGREIPVHAAWGIGEVKDPAQPGDDELIETMIGLLQGIDANDPKALSEAVETTATHPRLKMPDGHTAGVYRWAGC